MKPVEEVDTFFIHVCTAGCDVRSFRDDKSALERKTASVMRRRGVSPSRAREILE